LIYLASPYTHPDPEIQHLRYLEACYATVALTQRGFVVFSPIVHSHALVPLGLGGTWEFWEHIDREFISRCDELVVLKIAGWKESVGVQAEIAIAGELRKPVRYIQRVEKKEEALADHKIAGIPMGITS